MEEQECPEETSEIGGGVQNYRKTSIQSMLILPFIHFFRFPLNVVKFCKFLILGGIWFQIVADLIMNELLDTDFSTVGTNNDP